MEKLDALYRGEFHVAFPDETVAEELPHVMNLVQVGLDDISRLVSEVEPQVRAYPQSDSKDAQVNAYVTPIFDNNQVVGFESVRVKPTAEQVRRAEKELGRRIGPGHRAIDNSQGIIGATRLQMERGEILVPREIVRRIFDGELIGFDRGVGVARLHIGEAQQRVGGRCGTGLKRGFLQQLDGLLVFLLADKSPGDFKHKPFFLDIC